MRFDFDIRGDVQVSRELLRFADRAVNVAPALSAVAAEMRSHVSAQFSSEGGRASGGWASLAPATVEYKAHYGLRPETLRATDRLLRSLTMKGDSDAVEEVRPDELTFGSKVEYGGFHQSGTWRMPRRRPVEFRERDRVAYMRAIQSYIMTGQTQVTAGGIF